MLKMLRCLTILMLLIISICATGCDDSANSKIRFGTAGVGGMYYSYASNLVKVIESDNHDYNFDVKNTAGSAANLRLLSDNFLDLAIVQSDTLSDAIRGTGIFVSADPAKGYAAVAGLYTEACQVIVPKDSDITDIYALADKRVSIGEKESGVLQNATEILLAHGLTVEMIQPSYLSFADSAEALERGEIDAFFCTAGTPTNAVHELAMHMEIRLLEIAPEIVNNMMRLYSGYTRCTVPADTYSGQDSDVNTLGVKAVLIANTNLDSDKVAYITEMLLKNAEVLGDISSNTSELNIDYAVRDIPCAFHAGAAKYYESQGVNVEVYSGGESVTKVKAGQD